MARIFLTHIPHMLQNYYGERAVAALRKLGDVTINPGTDVLDAKALFEASKGCDIIVSDRQTPGPGAFFEMGPDAVAFLRCAVDIRNIDVPAASKQGILVTHATPGFIASVSEQTIGMMVDCARNVSEYVMDYRTGKMPAARPGRQLKGANLGIMGYGEIGQYLAPLGVALGMNVMISDPFKTIEDPKLKQVDLPTLLQESDFVVCLVVANEKTENLMNEAAFAQMKPSAFFINMSRGNLVDEGALIRALDKKIIAGAAMDVGRAQDQMPSLELARRKDVIATPHSAGLTPQAIEHQAFDTVNQVAELVAGRMPPGAANPDAGTKLSRLRKG
jgi:D-3-phosphoglycerate dehydrogenase